MTAAPPPVLPPSRLLPLATTAAACLAVLLLFASARLAERNLRGVEASNTLGDRVHAAQLASETVLSTLKDAETGQRGYLLTGDPAYLEPYEAARARLDRDFGRLQAAPVMNPERERRVERIPALADAKLAELGRTIALGRAGQEGAALAMVRTNQGKRVRDAIRAEADALPAGAEARLARARAETKSAQAWAGVVGLAASAALLLAGVALAQRRMGLAVAKACVTLERLTRAFGLAQGMLRRPDGRIIYWNEGTERLYGYRPEEALGRISHELLQTEFPQPLPEIEAELARAGYWQGELLHRHKDGSEMAIASQWALQPGLAGESPVVIEINHDITGLRRAEAALRDIEAERHLALEAAGLGVWRWEVGGNTDRLEWDARCKALFGLPPDATVTYATWAGLVAPEDRTRAEALVARALDPADPEDSFACEYPVRHPDGAVLCLAALGRATFAPDATAPAGRRATRIMGTIGDVTARRRADALLHTIINAVPSLIYAKDRQGRMRLANGPVADLIGKPWAEVEGRTDLEFLEDPAQADAVVANDRRVMEQGRSEVVEERVGAEDGRARVWLSTKTPLRDADGAVIGLVGVSMEITERKQAEERLHLVLHELNHRVKNTLATVQAIASQTLRAADPAVGQTLEARLMALAAAHDVLTREGWEGAELEDVVAGALAPHGGRADPRFQVSGPKLRLVPRAALALALGLHELATNAVKYGALAGAGTGCVELRWEIASGTAPRFRLLWAERGGPPVALPARRGFGTRLIERGLAQDLGGSVAIGFGAAGVTCAIDAPLDQVAAPAPVLPLPRVGRAGEGQRWG
ncbi:MAG: CHASE3 domain-containing protein [Acetobacteraceae bacterium]|nr:CHASE3 domain-containing protein [Acetobacteraceae bacterium]